jgi:O-antigen/teichoic acid export membrane protein
MASEVIRPKGEQAWGRDIAEKELGRKTVRGALVSTAGQACIFVLRTGSLMVLARLLLKEDFGLVNMVTAFTGFLGLLRDAGLGMAAIQRASITRGQASTLFWVNFAVGALLALLTAAIAPLLVMFYGEPRLFWVTVALGTTFLFNGAGGQHRAMLQRSMRFAAQAVVDMASVVVSIAVGIAMAASGYGYWALVAMAITPAAAGLPGVWLATGWIPGMPQRRAGVRTMLAYGGAVTLNNLMFYLAYNADKVLIGRFWGAGALGIYGRAYQLVTLPNDTLNSNLWLVVFPALSRVQHDPIRIRAHFLKAYSLVLSLVVPISMGCVLFADDIILIVLGPKWHEAAPIFRLLAPTILSFALLNGLGWLMLALGQAGRNLRIALAVTPVLLLSYVLGLRYGPHGVAVGFSLTMVLATVPIMLWAKQDTLITMQDMLRAIWPSAASSALGAAAIVAAQSLVQRLGSPFGRLAAESTIFFGVYVFALLFVMKQAPVYVGLLRVTGIKWPLGSSSAAEKT